MSSVEGYCVACKAMRELRDAKQIERSGLPTIEGTCPVCNSKIFVLGAGVAPSHVHAVEDDRAD
jgi:DNA-directed RNA polymerase subunit RPC12/RpoP